MLSVEAESGRCRRTLHKWSIALLAKEMVEHIAAGSVTRSRALSFVKELATAGGDFHGSGAKSQA